MAVFLAIFFSFFRATSPTRPTDALKTNVLAYQNQDQDKDKIFSSFYFLRTTSPTRPTDAPSEKKAKGQVLKSVAGVDWNSGNKDQNLKQNQCYLCNNRLSKLLICQKFYGVLAFAAAFTNYLNWPLHIHCKYVSASPALYNL